MCRLRTSCGPRAGLVRTPWFPAVVPRTCSTDHHYFQRKLGEKLPCCGHLYLLVLSRNFRHRLAPELLVTNFAHGWGINRIPTLDCAYSIETCVLIGFDSLIQANNHSKPYISDIFMNVAFTWWFTAKTCSNSCSKHMIFTMVQLACTWCLHVPRMCSKQVLSRNHRSSIGETSWCDFLAMLVCGVPCGRTSPYQSWCNYRGCL